MGTPAQSHLPAQAVNVHRRLSPFHRGEPVQAFPEGANLTQIVWEAIDRNPICGDITVLLNDWEVPKEYWDHCRPKEGALVCVNVLPAGGEGLRSIAMIGVAAAAIAVSGGALAGPLGTGFAAGSWGANIAALGVMTVGMLAVNALIPLPQPKFETDDTSPVLSITGARNQARPFSPIPMILGKYRYTPPYAAKPYTQIEGNDQFLTLLFTLGYGPLAIDEASARIGDTLLTNFSDYEIEYNPGFADDPGITLYQGTADPIPINVRIEYGWCPECPGAPGTEPPGLPNKYDRSVVNSDSAAIDITLPNGLIDINDNGNRMTQTVDVRVSYALTASPTFEADMTANEQELVPGGLTAKTNTAIRKSITLTFPTVDDYTVRVFRNTFDDPEGTTEDGDNSRWSATWWTGLTAFDSTQSPIISAEDDCLSLIALRIKATDQLSGVIDQYSVEAQSIVLDYDGTPGSWTYRPTSNPAALFRAVLQGPACGRRVSDDRIDLAKLEQWYDWCEAFSPALEFNMVRDFQSSMYDALKDVSAAAAARPVTVDGKWSVIYDDANLYLDPVQLFSPRNSWAFRATKQFPDHPHAYRVRYVDAENDYTQQEIVQYNVGPYDSTPYDDTTATIFESVEFPGLVTASQNKLRAAYNLGVAKWRLERFQFQCDVEHVVCTQGDAILVEHDSVEPGDGGAARVKSINGSDVTLDAVIETAGLTTVGMVYRDTDGTAETAVVTPVGGTETDTFTHPGPLPAVGALAVIGESTTETYRMVVDAVVPGNDDSATISCYPAYFELPPIS